MKRKPPLLDKRYSKHRAVSDEEKKLWLESVNQEKPVVPEKKQPTKQKTDRAIPLPSSSPHTVKRKPLVSQEAPILDKMTFAKIRREKLTIEATLDLHGYTRETAMGVLARFLKQAQARGLRTVIIITGKGNANKEGVLRRMLPLWLNESPLRERIISYDNASSRHGGAGAWYVRIRKGTEYSVLST